MITTLFRIIKYGFQSFVRGSSLSVATVIVLVLALIVFEGLIVFNEITETAVLSIKDKIDVSVYFKTNVSDEEIFKIKKSLESAKEIKSVEFISREKALELFKEKYQGDSTITQALNVLEETPLLASLNIKAHDPKDYPVIDSYLNNESFKDLIAEKSFTKSRFAIERLTSIVGNLEKLGLALTIFLAITAALVTFNTIRLAIYANRDEISIMRLVGASNVFINGPYIVEAVILGIIASIVSLGLLAPLINFSSPYVQSFIPEMDLSAYFYGNLFRLFGYQLILGIVLGIVSGSIAIRRY